MITQENKPPAKRNKMNLYAFVSRVENMILTGAFKPRERLTEAALSEMFGVSRYTVRDAFKVLETKALVTVTPFRGVVVSELSSDTVEEIFVIRAALEQLAMRMSTVNMTQADIKVLRKKVKMLEQAYRTDDFSAMVTADTDFHDYVFQMSRNGALHRLINDLRNRCHIIRYSAWSSPAVLQKVMEEHALIVDAIETKNVEMLNELAERHIGHGKNAYIMRLKAETALLK